MLSLPDINDATFAFWRPKNPKEIEMFFAHSWTYGGVKLPRNGDAFNWRGEQIAVWRDWEWHMLDRGVRSGRERSAE